MPAAAHAKTPHTAPDLTLAQSVTIDDLRAAASRIDGRVRRTPVLTGTPIDAVLSRQLKGLGPRVASAENYGNYYDYIPYHAIALKDD